MEFLAKVGAGRTIASFKKNQPIFTQGDLANAVFYIQKGRIRISVIAFASAYANPATARMTSM